MSGKNDKEIYFAVYLTLLALTALTAASYFFGFGALLGVVFAIGVASAKACMIAYYFMHLREASAVYYGIAVVGVLAVLILAVGIMPDIALRL